MLELLLSLDRMLSLALFRQGEHFAFRWGMIAFTLLGSGATLLLLLPFLRRNHRWSNVARSLLAACLCSALMVFVLKHLFARPRPYRQLHLVLWDSLGLVRAPTDPSFPSGHAAGAFTVAAVLVPSLWRAGRKKLAFAVLASAIFIAISRVVLGAHYLSDVAAGAVLGFAVGSFVRLRTTKRTTAD